MDRSRYEAAPTFREYLDQVEKNAELWRAVHERVRLPDELMARARQHPGTVSLAALSEDWCGDAVNTLPVVARLAEEVGWDFRVFSRDENPDLMDAHLTGGTSRSIPVVMVYDHDFREVGWWGPRPREIQTWVMDEGLSMPSADRYKEVRRWYARDRGRSTVEEVLDVLEPASARV